jgi:3'-phosphoadenosine 5'-phosphosulfate sulfotransferase (PAPS reductase)/FAD synthetase
MKTISWFSAGVSSAVATKLAINEIDRIVYIHIDDQHEDTLRFVKDCESWFGKEIEIIQSPLKTVENGCLQMAFVNSPQGPSCSRLLKRRVRQIWERENNFFQNFRYVWGMDKDEQKRMSKLKVSMPQQEHLFPLADIEKAEAHGILAKAGIKRPAMYDLGYHNNNCVGCVRGGCGYWNKIRVDFPEVFVKRSAMERRIGGSCLKKKISETETIKLFLDELDSEAGRKEGPIVPECGAMCEVAAV